jgi:hypothetical protein
MKHGLRLIRTMTTMAVLLPSFIRRILGYVRKVASQ